MELPDAVVAPERAELAPELKLQALKAALLELPVAEPQEPPALWRLVLLKLVPQERVASAARQEE